MNMKTIPAGAHLIATKSFGGHVVFDKVLPSSHKPMFVSSPLHVTSSNTVGTG